MPTLTMCVGLPGSGKTTWAEEQVRTVPYTARVSKDDIRADLSATGWSWSPEEESVVLLTRDQKIESYLSRGFSVISDDTNFAPKHERRLRELAKKYKVGFEVKRFDTPVEECIRRDSLRAGKAKVGKEVIADMAKRYGLLEPTFERYVPNERLMNCIICDLDGTLALNNGHRSFYNASKAADDELNWPVRKVIEVFYRMMNYQIIYLSGREEKDREPTQAFLRKHTCPPGPLYMRKTGDHRKDWIVKGELFDQHVRPNYNVVFCLDDRNQVVKFWRSIGLTVFQVNDGDF